VVKESSEEGDDWESVCGENGRAHMVTNGDDTLSVTGNRSVVVSENDKFYSKSKDDTIKTTFALDAGDSVHIGQKKASLDMHGEMVLVHSLKLVHLDCPSRFALITEHKYDLKLMTADTGCLIN
jgi:hypothetical protein